MNRWKTIHSFARQHYIGIILTTLIILGFAIRLYHLDWQCLTADERTTFEYVSNKTLPQLLVWALGSDYNPPLFYLLSKVSTIAFGEATRYALRFPFMILGTLAIPLSYLLGKEIEGKWTGIFTAIFIAASFPFIYYSQNARAYMLVFVAFLAFTIYYVRVYRGDNSQKTIIIAAVLAALCLWSHFYSIIPICIMSAFLIREHFLELKKGICVAILVCLPFVYYITVVINHLLHFQGFVHSIYWLTPSEIAITTPYELFGQGWVVIAIAIGYTMFIYQDRLYAILFVTGILTALTCIPMALVTAMSARYALIVSPLLFIVAIYPIVIFMRTRTLQQQMIIVAMVAYFIFITNYGSMLSFTTFNICPYVGWL
jgi:uncharacterized membrane protein